MMVERDEEIEGLRVITKRARTNEQDEEIKGESVVIKRMRMGERDQESD